MRSDQFHPTDQEILLAADGELPPRRTAQVRAHLAACWDCRARMAEVEATIADFARAHRQSLDPQLPSIAGSRALLRAQLAELAAIPKLSLWQRFFQFSSAARTPIYICAVFFLAAMVGGILFQHSTLRGTNSAVIASERGAVPDPSLTPGATRRVTVGDVCAMPHEDVVRAVPASLRHEVLQKYGIANVHADDYEVDYLIAPGLGGAEDVHNLWPEPYKPLVWNAHVKDDLEEHLHQMVCAGKLDLPTAQRDIAADWIAAYKKYFHTDRPLAGHSDLVSRWKEPESSNDNIVTSSLKRNPVHVGRMANRLGTWMTAHVYSLTFTQEFIAEHLSFATSHASRASDRGWAISS